MQVQFTRVHTGYANPELARALRDIIPQVRRTAQEYSRRDDKRKLVVVCLCPCCASDPLLDEENAVFVSPFCGIDRAGYDEILRVEKYPPYRTPGEDREAATEADFLKHFQSTIEKALAEQSSA